jgi:hypothetical protein
VGAFGLVISLDVTALEHVFDVGVWVTPPMFSLVQEALEERAHMLNVAPYMNHPLPIMIPLYE